MLSIMGSSRKSSASPVHIHVQRARLLHNRLAGFLTQSSPRVIGKLPLQNNSPLGDNLCINNIPWQLCIVYTYIIMAISLACNHIFLIITQGK